MKHCQCGAQTNVDPELAISLEHLLLELEWNIPSELSSSLSLSCDGCLQSMINDVRGELTAVQERSMAQLDSLFQIVDPNTEPYRMVLKHFSESVKNEIIRVERINNPPLQSEFETACRASQSSVSDIRWLFHGSNNDNYINISKGGFDIKRSKNGTLGVGVYFAETASYSAGYTNRIQEKTKSESTHIVANILLCKVDLRPEDGHIGDIYCIRNDRRAYPQYIIYYQSI